MRRRRLNPCSAAVFYNEPTDIRSNERSTTSCEQQRGVANRLANTMGSELPASVLEVATHRLLRIFTERHDARFAAFAADHELGFAGMHIAQAKIDDLLAAQPATIQQLKNSAVAQAERVGGASRRE
jgi:hypothetical protein